MDTEAAEQEQELPVPLAPTQPPKDASSAPQPGREKKQDALGCFDRYLSLWVLLSGVIGVLLGHFVPEIPEALDRATVAQISLPVAMLIWVMVYPMLLLVDLSSIRNVRRNWRPVAITSGINYLVQPFVMYALARLFFNVVFSDIIDNPALEDEYVAGAVILGGSPCTAMVFVWSSLTYGDPAYTLVQVAINDLLIFVFYIPTTMLLLQVTSISVPWDTAFLSVILFMCVPGLLAYATRRFALRYRSKAWLLQLSARFKPITMVALLGTLLLIFLFQGEQIVDNPLHVLLIAVPLTIQTYSIFFLAYSVFFWLRTPFEYAAPGALIATSNFFELAVAVAMALFGADSGATLVTTVGVLEEVPIMLSLVWLANRTRHWFPQPAALRVRAGKLAVESHLIPEERRIQLKALAALLQPQVSTSNNATVDTEGGASVRASVVFVGTHNSRRSQLAEVWLRAAAVYYQLDNINVSSAGIETTELSQAMAAALSQAGFFLRRSRGCLRRWCSRRKDDGNDDMQPHYHCATGWLGEQRLPDVELFSKGLNHPSLPSTDFVAVLVCNSADSACPLISGTRARILLPYEDPKQHDGTPDASAAYEAAVDIIGLRKSVTPLLAEIDATPESRAANAQVAGRMAVERFSYYPLPTPDPSSATDPGELIAGQAVPRRPDPWGLMGEIIGVPGVNTRMGREHHVKIEPLGGDKGVETGKRTVATP